MQHSAVADYMPRGGLMKGRIWTTAAGVAAIGALIAVPSALAAYTTPKLEVRQVGTVTTFKVSQTSSEDATGSLRILVPTGTTLTTTQAPGTTLGTVNALLKLHALAGAEVPVIGQVVVAAPGQVPEAIVTACTSGATPTATWVLALNIAGNPVNVPLFLVPTSGALAAFGPAYIQTCIASPYVPPAQGGATGGAQLVTAEFSVDAVFGRVSAGAFLAIFTPWTPGTATINAAGTVASPAAIAPGAVTIRARAAGKGAVVSGTVTQGGQGRGGVKVTIRGGAKRTGMRRLTTVTSRANGSYSFRAKGGTFFRATAVAMGAAAPPLCTLLGGGLAQLGIPCVNPTVNGFTVSSATIRKR
jgi:hypothetical protein